MTRDKIGLLFVILICLLVCYGLAGCSPMFPTCEKYHKGTVYEKVLIHGTFYLVPHQGLVCDKYKK